MEWNEISCCRGCHGGREGFRRVLRMAPMPLAGMFCLTRAEALAAPKLPLTWVQCSQCGLVQVLENVPDGLLYSHYNYASSSVPGLVRHFDDYALVLRRHYGADRDLRFLEIGCNDGVLLNRLPRAWRLTGVDPSDVARDAHGRESAYALVNLPLSPSLVDERSWQGEWEVVAGSNCFAHISDMGRAFEAVAMALKPEGEFWLEVHDLDALLRGAQWDTIYHEHKAEWSLRSLRCCLWPLGLRLVSASRRPLHGGVIRAVFKKEARPAKALPPPDLEGRHGALSRLALSYERRYLTASARRLLAAMRRKRPIGAYGAAGRANVYLNQMADLDFRYIVDESALRLNRHIPCRGTPIVPRGRLVKDPCDLCLITAWNYRVDIVAKNPDFPGQWLTAFGEEA